MKIGREDTLGEKTAGGGQDQIGAALDKSDSEDRIYNY